MGRSQETSNKKEVRDRKAKKRKEKEQKKLERKDFKKSGHTEEQFAYVDEFGNISSTPPDPLKKKTHVDADAIVISTPRRSEADRPDPIRRGTVSFFNDSKGFGFIRDSETGESIFVHINDTLEEIREGNAVRFEITMGKRGPAAMKVEVLR